MPTNSHKHLKKKIETQPPNFILFPIISQIEERETESAPLTHTHTLSFFTLKTITPTKDTTNDKHLTPSTRIAPQPN